MLFFCFLATGHNMLSRVAKITFDSDLDTGQSEELLQDVCDDFNVFRYAQSATKLLTPEIESSLEVGQYHVDSLFAKSIERDTEKSVHSLAYKESLLMSLDYQACPVPLATLKLTKTDYLFEDALLRHAHNDSCPQAILVDTLGVTRDILWLQQNLCIRVRIWFGTRQSIILVGKPGFGQCLVELSIAGSKYWWTVLAAYTSAFSITSTSCEFQLQPKHCNILRNMGNTMVCLLRSFVDGNHRVFEASARYFAIAYYSAESQQVVTTQLIHVSHCDLAKICRDNGQVTRFDNFPWDLFVHSAVIGVYVQSAWLNQKRSLFSVLISHVMIAALARTPTVTDIAVHIYENSGRCRSMLESELSLVAAKDEMTSLKVCIIRMTGGQSDIYYVIGKSRKSVQNSPFLEKLMTGGYAILFRENVVDAYAAGKLKEYDGTKLVSATKERLKLEAIDEKQRKKEDTKKSFDSLCKSIKDILGDKVQKMIICDRIVNSPCRLVIGEYGWPTYLTRVMKACLLRSSSMSAYMSREKVVEIKWDSGILQELSKKAEVDKNDKYVEDLVLLLHAVGRDGTVMPALEEKENSHLTIAGNTRVIYQASGKVCFTIAPAGWSFTLQSFAKPYVKPHGVSFDAAKFAESSFLPKLGFRPFYYGLKIMYAYENILAFSQKVLDLLEDLIAKLAAELPDGFGLSMVLAYLIVVIVPHVFIYAYIFATKRKYSFRVYREVHEYLQGLSKFDAAPASPVNILAYKHYYAPDDRSVSWSLCARCVHHGTVFTMSSLTKVNRLLLSTFILWFPSCQHGFIFAQCYLPEGFQIVTVIICWSLLSGNLHLSQFALVGFGRSLDNTHWVNVALTSPNKKLYNVGLYSIVYEIFGVMGQLLARIRYILSFSELMIMKIVGISNHKMVEVLVGFFVLNLEDKVLIEGRGIVMNVTKLEDTFVELSNYVWDPG